MVKTSLITLIKIMIGLSEIALMSGYLPFEGLWKDCLQ